MVHRGALRMRWLSWMVSAALASVLLAPAATAARFHRLQGACTLTGRITFGHPVGMAPRPVRYSDRSSGTCTGTIDGVHRKANPVIFPARGRGNIGCSTAHTTSVRTLTFPVAHTTIHVVTHGLGGTTELAATLAGRVSGTGLVLVSLHGDAASAAACVSGTLSSIGYQLTGSTVTPVIG